jgi:hypothetical protein
MMKLLLSLSFIVAVAGDAKSKYIKNLLNNAVPTANSQLRRLDQAAAEQEEAFEVNIATYSVKFEQCQFVKSYSAELAADEESTTVLETERFVLFRLCPNGTCSNCNYNYGEYLVDLDSYLESTVEYFQAYQEAMCEACQQTCYQAANEDANAAEGEDAAAEEDAAADGEDAAADDGARRKLGKNKFYNIVPDCTVCLDECDKIDNMEANGFIDATNFLECTMIYDPEDDNKAALYAGPICASSGTKIKIGVFTDENCIYLDESKEVDDYVVVNGVSMNLSNLLLKSTYTDTCISCKEPVEQNENAEGDAEEDADEVTELCENLYNDAAKCEKAHGFANGYASYYGYENQLAEEEVVCEYMGSLKAGTYDESGEIVVSGAASHGKSASKSTTGGQKFALTFFILGTVGLAVYAAMLHSKLVKGKKPDLASQGALA